MDAEPKKRFHTITFTVILLLLLLAYVLSYAPAVRFGLESPPFDYSIAAYKPVEWLIDETPLRRPLFLWTDVWGVRDEVFRNSRLRTYPLSPTRDVVASLDEVTEIDFNDDPLDEAMAFLSDLHKITIVVDESALARDGIAVDEPITLLVSDVSLRSALRTILRPLELTYVIEDGVMKITTY